MLDNQSNAEKIKEQYKRNYNQPANYVKANNLAGEERKNKFSSYMNEINEHKVDQRKGSESKDESQDNIESMSELK